LFNCLDNERPLGALRKNHLASELATVRRKTRSPEPWPGPQIGIQRRRVLPFSSLPIIYGHRVWWPSQAPVDSKSAAGRATEPAARMSQRWKVVGFQGLTHRREGTTRWKHLSLGNYTNFVVWIWNILLVSQGKIRK